MNICKWKVVWPPAVSEYWIYPHSHLFGYCRNAKEGCTVFFGNIFLNTEFRWMSGVILYSFLINWQTHTALYNAPTAVAVYPETLAKLLWLYIPGPCKDFSAANKSTGEPLISCSPVVTVFSWHKTSIQTAAVQNEPLSSRPSADCSHSDRGEKGILSRCHRCDDRCFSATKQKTRGWISCSNPRPYCQRNTGHNVN